MEPWWKSYHVAQGQAGVWHVGCLSLSIEHYLKEWRTGYQYGKTVQEWYHEITPPQSHQYEVMRRVVFSKANNTIQLNPCVADRSIIIRPETAFMLPKKEEIIFYIGTPLWLRVSMDQAKEYLLDLATQRLTDTWFGPNETEGELCYASKSKARTELTESSHKHNHAVTAVKIFNNAQSPMYLERIKLPVPLFSLYFDQNQRVWTESVVLTREEEASATLKIDKGPPREAVGCDKIAPSREVVEENILVRTLNSLFR